MRLLIFIDTVIPSAEFRIWAIAVVVPERRRVALGFLDGTDQFRLFHFADNNTNFFRFFLHFFHFYDFILINYSLTWFYAWLLLQF